MPRSRVVGEAAVAAGGSGGAQGAAAVGLERVPVGHHVLLELADGDRSDPVSLDGGAVHLDGVGRGLHRPTGSDVAHRGLVGDADPGGFSGVRGDGDAYLVTGSDVGGVKGLSKVVAAPRQDR